jgi:hypothetical protein
MSEQNAMPSADTIENCWEDFKSSRSMVVFITVTALLVGNVSNATDFFRNNQVRLRY